MALAHARQVIGRVISPFYRHQTFIWQWAPAEPGNLDVALPEGFSLVRATEADLPLLAQLDADFARARDFLAAGHQLWFLLDGDRLVYSTWGFAGRAPTDAVRSGWIELPEGALNSEDSITHPDRRGRGYSGLAGQLINARLVREGWRRYVFAALTTNTSSLRASAKGPSRPFALVDVKKFGLLRRDSDWRNRRGDSALTFSRVRVSQPEIPGGATPAEEELLAWLRAALRSGVAGPAPAATAPRREAVAAS